MKTGERWSSGKIHLAAPLFAAVLLLHAPGCAKDREAVSKNLMAEQSALRNEGVPEHYRVGCPDVIELVVPARPEFDGRHEIGPDGRIEFADYDRLRIEGRTPPEIARLVARETGVDAAKVEVRVVEFRSQHVLLFGEVIGWQRRVSYRGQETVLDLLQRVGGITPGAEPRHIYVLRPHVGENRRPEAFHVDLHDIVLNHDHKTNIRLMPFDQVYVGETRRAEIEKALPPWLRPAYQVLWNANGDAKSESEPPGSDR
jgi:protein involved in polysaccharide export with SLBB domain